MNKRFATLEDSNELFSIEKTYFHSPWTKEQFFSEINENEFAKIIVLEEEGKIIGYIDYWIIFDQAQINKICIIEEYRKKGLATSLLNDAFLDMKENEVFSITLEVRVSNLKAQKLYEKMGFKTILTKKGYYSDGEDAFYMIKGGFEL